MVRLSSPISSRLILAGSCAMIGGIIFYCIFRVFYWMPLDEISSTLYRSPDAHPLQGAIELISALGPLFGILTFTMPFVPFTFVYASRVCPSRITITSTEIRAKCFTQEKVWPMSELSSVKFQTAGNTQFIVFRVAGKTLKAEVEHGTWGRIRDLIPVQIADPIGTEARPSLAPAQISSYPQINALHYISKDEFETDYRTEIYEQANKLAEAYDWWMEPLWLFDRLSYMNRLTGQSQLQRPNPVDCDSIPILGKEIPARENALMSFIDAQRIFALLQTLSREHEITWTIYAQNGSDELGTIENGVISPAIDLFLTHVRESWNITKKELEDETLHQRIREKHIEEISSPAYNENTEYLPLPPEQEVNP